MANPSGKPKPEFVPLFVNWDAEYSVLVDQMGIMIPRADVEALASLCLKHLQEHSGLEREAIGRRTVERLGKGTSNQFNYDWFSEADSD